MERGMERGVEKREREREGRRRERERGMKDMGGNGRWGGYGLANGLAYRRHISTGGTGPYIASRVRWAGRYDVNKANCTIRQARWLLCASSRPKELFASSKRGRSARERSVPEGGLVSGSR